MELADLVFKEVARGLLRTASAACVHPEIKASLRQIGIALRGQCCVVVEVGGGHGRNLGQSDDLLGVKVSKAFGVALDSSKAVFFFALVIGGVVHLQIFLIPII